MLGRIKHVRYAFAFLTDIEGVDRFVPRAEVLNLPADTNDLCDVLQVGMVVEFTPQEHEYKGPRAAHLTVPYSPALPEFFQRAYHTYLNRRSEDQA